MTERSEIAERIAAAVPRLVPGCECEEMATGLRIKGPTIRRGPLGRRMARVFKWSTRIEVELDDVGAWVYERIDGRSLHELADQLADHLKLTHREAEAALTVFLQMLLKRKLITLDVHTEATT